MEKEKISELIVQTKKDNSLAKKPCLGTGSKGIHHVPFPDWIVQKYPKNGFQFLLANTKI